MDEMMMEPRSEKLYKARWGDRNGYKKFSRKEMWYRKGLERREEIFWERKLNSGREAKTQSRDVGRDKGRCGQTTLSVGGSKIVGLR